ncbi:hypothetical protein [Roseicyclus amphidinii]|uniref:hypothetical protein n=1 Tax=Roseicyclus amphidinii TaxID=3034232 RepID=UPI0024E06459|nr:hypothetical protein [Roseicyclus sp. Amp-Y-6]
MEVGGIRPGFTHTSIDIYEPSGARVASVELVTDGISLDGSFSVTFQSAADRVVNGDPQYFVSGLDREQAEQLLNEAFSAAVEDWTRGGEYELPPSVAINPRSISMGIALGSGVPFPPEFYQEYYNDISGRNDPFIHNSNAFARLVHDQVVARANAYGYGQTAPIVDDNFGLPAPG